MNYWQRRQQQLNQQLEKDEARLKKWLSSFYDTEFRKLDRQIAAYYKQYGTDHVIEYRQLLESLPPEDKRLLIEQMDAFAEKYPQYAHLMPVRETVYKLDRLEGLQYSVRMQQLEIGAATQKEIREHLERQALRGGDAAAQAMGFGENFYSMNPDVVTQFVGAAWSNGENFSQKIWKNTEKLAGYLNTDIAQGFARGDSYEKLVRNLRQRFGKVSRKDAYRLIYTEGTYVMAEATMQPFTEDFEEYRLSTAADGKACDICRELAKKKFRIQDRQPGVNFPPLHPWCRCTFTIEVEDWDEWMEDYERRYGNGQSGKVADRFNNENVVAKGTDSAIIESGARIINLFSKEADEFAEMYYMEIRSFSTDTKKIADNLKKPEEDIRRIKNYLFEHDSLYDPDTGEWKRFDPDCAIAQSWQRLMIGKDIKPHDRTLIEHELLEMRIKMENPNMPHQQAHALAAEKYDYGKEALEYYGNLEKHKENRD